MSDWLMPNPPDIADTLGGIKNKQNGKNTNRDHSNRKQLS